MARCSKISKIPIEELKAIVLECQTWHELIKKVGYKAKSGSGGGVFDIVRTYIHQNKIDISHFVGNGWAKNKTRFNDHGVEKQAIAVEKPWDESFCKGSKTRNAYLIKRLIVSGKRHYACEKCNMSSWQGEPLRLQLDHIDGDRTNNEENNLQILCPNCHTQTSTFCRGNSKNSRKFEQEHRWWQQLSIGAIPGYASRAKTNNPVCHCGNIKSKQAVQCYECELMSKKGRKRNAYKQLRPRKFDPTKEDLERLVWEIPTEQIGKLFGVSDKAIEKRCKKLGIEKPSRGYWAKKRLSGKIKPEARKLNISKEELQTLAWEMSQTKMAKKLGVSRTLISERCIEYSITLPPHGYWRKMENK